MASAREFDPMWRSLIPAALILCAGLVAYVGEAAGEFGHLVAFGRADANAGIPTAWIQFPLHAGLAFLLLIGRPRGLLWLAWGPGRVGLILLVVCAASLTLVLVDRLFTADYPVDVGSAMLLLLSSFPRTATSPAWKRTPGRCRPFRSGTLDPD